MFYVRRNYTDEEKEKIANLPQFNSEQFEWGTDPRRINSYRWDELCLLSPPRCGTQTILYGIQEFCKTNNQAKKSEIIKFGYGKPVNWYKENKPKFFKEILSFVDGCQKMCVVRNPYKRVVSSLYKLHKEQPQMGWDKGYAVNRKRFLSTEYGVPQWQFCYHLDGEKLNCAFFQLEEIVDKMLSVAHYEFDMDDAQNVTPNRLKYRLTHEEYDMISEDFNDDFRWLGYTPISL
jgi:hypothetical protein